jgi:AmmeMemoRadiSam system protein A
MSPLPSEARLFLLRLARKAIEARLSGERIAAALGTAWPIPTGVQQRAGAFVSLHRFGTLRGCVGLVEPRLPLYRAVADAAAAVTRDPRFAPLAAAELTEIDLEISVLSPPQPIGPEEIRIGLHGLMVTQGWARGVLLPQVPLERGWSPQRFLEEACRKAGLAADAWQEGARVEAFRAEVFGEKMLARQMAG